MSRPRPSQLRSRALLPSGKKSNSVALVEFAIDAIGSYNENLRGWFRWSDLQDQIEYRGPR